MHSSSTHFVTACIGNVQWEINITVNCYKTSKKDISYMYYYYFYKVEKNNKIIFISFF